MLEEKNVRPFGQVKWLAWSAVHTPSMLPSVQRMTAIWTKHAQMDLKKAVVSNFSLNTFSDRKGTYIMTWLQNVIRGGTFMYCANFKSWLYVCA